MVSIGAETTKIRLPKGAELMGITPHNTLMNTNWLHFIYNSDLENQEVERTFKRMPNGIEIPDNWIWLGPSGSILSGGNVWHFYEEIA